MKRITSSVIVALACAMTSNHAESKIFSHPDRIKYDSSCFQIEGSDIFLYSGAFHYFRVPKALWPDRFQKLKEAGFNTVETYVPWNYHQRQPASAPGDYATLDLTELEEWITMAEKYGFYVIIRPGPYICAEWSGGGYPQWLIPMFKPKDWPEDKVWLQTDDPAYLAWNKHWYDAVAKVVAPHQVTRKAPGQPGVIMFQIENEYERLSWLDNATKTRNLAALADQSREAGIDVPIVTCWTKQSRNSSTPSLKGVFDFMNFYPKWEVEKKVKDYVEKQSREDSGAPRASMELQGGWYSEIGGQLSEKINGVQPAQTQNLTLYCLQLGLTALNYYMLVGGTNFDDWASREATTTYDFFAPIRENGGVGEKYRRVAGIGHMLQQHGKQLARTSLVDTETISSDPAVEIALRKSVDGTRFFFVRTEDRKASHTGSATVKEKNGKEFTFDFNLEPFGSQVLVLPPAATDAKAGEWFPKLAADIQHPAKNDLPDPISISKVTVLADPVPQSWEKLAAGDQLETKGIQDYHFRYYRLSPAPRSDFTIKRLGKGVINNRSQSDGVLVQVNGKLLSPKVEDQTSITFTMPSDAKEAILLHENVGLHHHTTATLEKNWGLTLGEVRSGDSIIPLEFANTERSFGLHLSQAQSTIPAGSKTVAIGMDSIANAQSLITWYRMEFELPSIKTGIWVPWALDLKALGNGFIYLNGHAIGRTWDIGPQHRFFLPESWLNFGPGKKNVVAISLRPTGPKVGIESASIIPESEFAEAGN